MVQIIVSIMQFVLTILHIKLYTIYYYFLVVSIDGIGLYICKKVKSMMDHANILLSINSTSLVYTHVYKSL